MYDEFEKNESINTSVRICKESSILIGKEVRIINRGKESIGKAIDLNDEGELLVQFSDGRVEKIISGEISVRGLNGYV
ncbi:bifunctional ligase/repressor BirA [Clostridium magnum DSM 2767]|uniref:Bifunctional ligase/repressor BirA n=1 Tax=Clostridium magnum DSM 2767 TaxID=1121326 RepID=A0A162R710_9CLOT|nr:bifunctional ligase/repressor BirA [Clostridium magnum DSM 2767]